MFEYQELHKFNGNCVHYMYEMSGFAEKLIIQNCVNSTRNCAHYMYGYFGLSNNWNIQNCLNSTVNCVQYMYVQSGFAEKMEN